MLSQGACQICSKFVCIVKVPGPATAGQIEGFLTVFSCFPIEMLHAVSVSPPIMMQIQSCIHSMKQPVVAMFCSFSGCNKESSSDNKVWTASTLLSLYALSFKHRSGVQTFSRSDALNSICGFDLGPSKSVRHTGFAVYRRAACSLVKKSLHSADALNMCKI
jgi:hypothetical protein